MRTEFSLVLKEKELDAGLERNDVIDLFDMLDTTEGIPFEVQAEHSVAMGFISREMAEVVDYIYDDINDFVSNILSDMNNENENGEYIFEYDSYEFAIYITR